MNTKKMILNLINTELDRVIKDTDEAVGLASETDALINQTTFCLLKLAKHTINENYRTFRVIPESILLNTYVPFSARLDKVTTLVSLTANNLATTLNTVLVDCYAKGTGLNIDLNKIILDSMQKCYAQLLK